MNYIDLIIKYLSGELSREESSSFEKELDSKDDLKRTFEEYSTAYALIRDQLQQRDNQNFRTKLEEAMNQELRSTQPRLHWLRKRWYIPVSAACTLAVFFSMLMILPSNKGVLTRYYKPSRDPVLLAFNQDTRGVSEPGVTYYQKGDYEKAMEQLEGSIAGEGNRQLLLYYLLSAIELDRQDEVLARIKVEESGGMDLVDQSIHWYAALANLKSGHGEMALNCLQPLTRQPGPYQSRAIRLEKLMLK